MIRAERRVLGLPIRAQAEPLDSGYDVAVYGGACTHVGAVSLAGPDGGVQTLEREGHRDAAVSERFAKALARAWNAPVCVRCGIHYERATRAQIDEILAACDALLADVLGQGAPANEERTVSMEQTIPVVNATTSLADCRGAWTHNAAYHCWCLEDVLYTPCANVPKFQRLSIFVPEAYMNADGTVNAGGSCGGYTAATAPVVFENNSAGYMQMPHTWLGGPRSYAGPYLKHGLVYVTCGCRGRESRDAQGRPVGKAPITLVDLKTAIRFLRHNADALPGDLSRIISVGWSAGGAMSSLLAVSGDNAQFTPYLEENGAFMDESDAVYAAQIYCPIVDLEHADMAYEWMFDADDVCEDSPAGPAETRTPFKRALSAALRSEYVAYVNSLDLRDPKTGRALTLGEDGRSGGFYDALMTCLDDAASEYIARLADGRLGLSYSVREYLDGRYMRRIEAPVKKGNPGMHHAGPGVGAAPEAGERPMGLGELMSRPPRGVPFVEHRPPMIDVPGTAKHDWLSCEGTRAHVSGLDAYVLAQRRRMKPCTSFDKLTCDSGENELFGNAEHDSVHFGAGIDRALRRIQAQFPEECARYLPAYAAAQEDAVLQNRLALINPMRYIGPKGESRQAAHYRIRVGASDADTSLSISMTLALRLANAGCGTVDYAMVWEQPHCEADYPGEVLRWIDGICRKDE